MAPQSGPTEGSLANAMAMPRWEGFEGYLLDQVQAAVIATDLDGIVTHWNRHASVLFGWTAEEALGRNIFDLTVLPGDAATAAEVMEKVQAGESWAGEFAVRRKDGSSVLCYVTDSPIFDPSDRVIGVVGVSVDITERKLAEQRLAARTAVTRVLAEARTVAEAAPKILQSMGEKLGWPQGAIWVIERRAGVLRPLDVWRSSPQGADEFGEVSMETVFPSGVGLPGRVWATGKPVWIPDVVQDDNFPRAPTAAEQGLHGAFGFPILLAGEVLGVIEFFSDQILEPDEELLQTMSVIGSQVGQFLERKQAEEAVIRSEAAKAAVLRAALDSVITIDHEGTILELNPAAERTFGYPKEEAVGREMAALIIPPQYREPYREGLARYLETGEGPILGRRIELTAMRADGTEFPVEVTITRVDHPGLPVFTGYIRDITDRRRAEDELRQSRDQLQTIFQGVSEGITVQDASGRLLYANDAAARIIGYPSVEALLEAPIEDITARFELWDEEGHAFPLEKLPGRMALEGQTGHEAVVSFRGRDTGETRWSLIKASPVFEENGRVQFAVNIFHDITERKRADDAQRFLVEASALLASSLNYRGTLRKLARLAVPRLADWCSVDMLEDDGTTSQLAVAHVDPGKVQWAKELIERYPPDPTEPGGVMQVIRSGKAQLYPEIPVSMLEQAAVDQEHLELIRSLGMRSAMVLPLVARGFPLGAITLVSAESGRRFGLEDLAFAEELASRAALAVDNARLYEEQSTVARALQQSLLPPQLPDIPGVELARSYRPAGRGNQVGGDFYDVFALGDGSWALVIGDVCGKGPSAAGVTGLARHTIRAAAMQEGRPSHILAALNEAIIQQRSDHVFCTVAMARMRMNPDSKKEAARLTVCSAGHPLPMILRADGSLKAAGVPGMLLGFFPDPELSDKAVDLEPGDALILFTDGVTEERSEGEIFGRERLEVALQSAAGKDAAGIASSIEQAVEAFRPEPARDDIAILVARVLP